MRKLPVKGTLSISHCRRARRSVHIQHSGALHSAGQQLECRVPHAQQTVQSWSHCPGWETVQVYLYTCFHVVSTWFVCSVCFPQVPKHPTCMHAYMSTHVNSHSHTHSHSHTYTHTRSHIYTHTLTVWVGMMGSHSWTLWSVMIRPTSSGADCSP